MLPSIPWNGRKHYGTDTSRQRHDHARYPSGNTAIASYERGAEPAAGHQRQDGRQVRKRETLEDRKTGPSEPPLSFFTHEALSQFSRALAWSWKRRNISQQRQRHCLTHVELDVLHCVDDREAPPDLCAVPE